MRSEFATHLATRLVSGLLSFYLFSVIARQYSIVDAKQIYFFLFLLGFFTAAQRALATVSAGIVPSSRRSAKLTDVHRAIVQVVLGACLMMPLAGVILSSGTSDPWVIASAVLIVGLCGLDVDLLRAAVGRSPAFPVAFALGSVLAVACISLPVAPAPRLAFAAVLLQWVPVCLLNLWMARRFAVRAGLSLRLVGFRQSLMTLALLIVALFDGVLLNLPFLLGDRVPAQLGVELAVVVRVHVASLLLFPLVQYWSNSGAILQIVRRTGLGTSVTYGLSQALAGIVAGTVFAIAYVLLSGKQINLMQCLGFAVLLGSYCVLSTAIRFKGRDAAALRLMPGLLVLLTLFAFALPALLASPVSSVLAVNALQGTFMMLGAAMVAISGKSRGGA